MNQRTTHAGLPALPWVFLISLAVLSLTPVSLEAAGRYGEKTGQEAMGRTQATYAPDYEWAEQVMGMNVQNRAGEDMGEIDELILDASGRHVTYAIVQEGGVLGIGDEDYVVPFHAFQIRPAQGVAFLDITREEFEKAPRYGEGERIDPSDAQWRQDVHDFYARACPYYEVAGRPYGERGMEQEGEATRGGKKRAEMTSREKTEMNPTYRRMSRVLGADVAGIRGEEMGQVEDIAIDMHHGWPVFATVEYGGFLGIGDSETIVPWGVMDLERDERVVQVDATREQFDQLAFRDTDAPRLGERDYTMRVYRVYDVEPVWMIYGFAEPGSSGEGAQEHEKSSRKATQQEYEKEPKKEHEKASKKKHRSMEEEY